jgi:hypothetical protein
MAERSAAMGLPRVGDRTRRPLVPLLPNSGICLKPGCWWSVYGPGWEEASQEHVRVHGHQTLWRRQVDVASALVPGEATG